MVSSLFRDVARGNNFRLILSLAYVINSPPIANVLIVGKTKVAGKPLQRHLYSTLFFNYRCFNLSCENTTKHEHLLSTVAKKKRIAIKKKPFF